MNTKDATAELVPEPRSLTTIDTTIARAPSDTPTGAGGPLACRTFEEHWRAAKVVAESGMVPKDYVKKPEAVLVAWQYGAELGLQPMAALQSIAVVNGRPSLWGDGLLGLCMGHPHWGDMEETDEAEAHESGTASCTVTRKGKAPVTKTFTFAMAEKAGLAGKTGPWSSYPGRMMVMRARSWALRSAYADVLRGTTTVEEARDTFAEERATTVVAEIEDRRKRIAEAAKKTKALTAKSKSKTAAEAVATGRDAISGEIEVVTPELTPDGFPLVTHSNFLRHLKDAGLDIDDARTLAARRGWPVEDLRGLSADQRSELVAFLEDDETALISMKAHEESSHDAG